jgi:hypothetical protein
MRRTGVRPDNTGNQQAIYRKGVASTRLERRKPAHPRALHFLVLRTVPSPLKPAAETQSARSASRRAQFQLWIFSYTILVGPSKKYVSRVFIDFTNDFSLDL